MSLGKSVLWILGTVAYFCAAAVLSYLGFFAVQSWPMSLLGLPERVYAFWGVLAALIAVGVWQAAVHARGMSRWTMAALVGIVLVGMVLLCPVLSAVTR